MLYYNSLVWEWVNLGLVDVIIAMYYKLNKAEFEIFYWRAIEIEMRGLENNCK